ncbi:pyridoxamine 5'-phosphate oxidase family protein [Bacillus sp. V33-4]|uniref:pyridoxamine 5'-phosphate oxidase family protein n=1 Tax=Bacillus sp. V33-4 TaxID=2054169 RepID=UPI000C786267|nr:pyridoxamine 5'-phosphate oxidase family protein [Bacillus sp. V33-4]PLR81555.1 pyridoxamine 5'-phosphate oxidase family protein [Bacillus sp. V33-4]
MNHMRQQKLAVQDEGKSNEFLLKSRIGYLGLSDGQTPYVIPLNFIWHEQAIYFHGASEGRKITIINNNPLACFNVCEEYGTMVDPVPAKTDTAYFSVVIQGKLSKVTGPAAATAVMQCMLQKYVPNYYDQPLAEAHVVKYRSSLGSKTAIYKLEPDFVSAKANPLNEDLRFYPGRSVQNDS